MILIMTIFSFSQSANIDKLSSLFKYFVKKEKRSIFAIH